MSEPARRLPVILVVDDEPTVLAAVARDLRQGFGERYRIVRAGSGEEALEVLRELVRRGEQVALLVADQRMPGLSGTDYLVRARELVPTAKRVLLTAYADTEAAIQAINEVDLDYYLLKPWDPPEDKLFPVVRDLVGAWEAGAALEAGGVRLIGHRFSRATHELRDFLARNLVPARWLDVERDAEARQLLKVAGVDDDRLPVALLEDGTVLERPRVLELAERLGVAGQPALEHYDLVIVGGGPAGLAAAVYGASEGLKTIMVEREGPGGQAGQSSRIENYLGFPAGLSGSELTQRATTQARRLGAELLTLKDTTGLRVEGSGRIVELSGGGNLSASTVLIASGGFLPPAERAWIRRADRTGHLLRRGPDRRARVQGPARRGDRRGQFRRSGGRVPLLVRNTRDDARPRRLAGEVDVALPDRADRGARQCRGADAERSRGRGGRRPPARPAHSQPGR
jgi:thioredoxin reductase (NADPH)